MCAKLISAREIVDNFNALTDKQQKEWYSKEKKRLAESKKKYIKEEKLAALETKRKRSVKREYFALLKELNTNQRVQESPGEQYQIDIMLASAKYTKENQTKLERLLGIDIEDDYDLLLSNLKNWRTGAMNNVKKT